MSEAAEVAHALDVLRRYARHVTHEKADILHRLAEAQFRSTYRGRKIVKNPFDFMVYAMLLTEYEPELIIEIGTHEGGSAMYYADLCPEAVVHTIDVSDSHPELWCPSRIFPFDGGWESYDIDRGGKQYDTASAGAFIGSKIVVIDDGSHRYADVLGAFRKFSPLVPVGGYYIVEDGIVDELGESASFNGGPLRAIREFLPGSGFEIAERWQNFFPLTFNVEGWLQRTS